MRRIVLHQGTEVDDNKNRLREAYLERRGVNRIEEGEETITRRFESRY